MNNGKGYADIKKGIGVNTQGDVRGQFNAEVRVKHMHFGPGEKEDFSAGHALKNLNPQEALYVAAADDDAKNIKRLVASGVNVNTPNANGLTALHIAAESGHVGAIQILLKIGAKINAVDKNRNTPLHLAKKNHHADAVQVLKQIRAAQEQQDALIKACEEGDIVQVKQILGQGAISSQPGSTAIQPLGAAVWGMNPEVVSALLEEMQDGSPLTWEECKEHNLEHYKEVFMFITFAPKNFREWHGLLIKMSRSLYLRALHLGEADKVWHLKVTSSWGKFVSLIDMVKGWECKFLYWMCRDQMNLRRWVEVCQNSQAVFEHLHADLERSIKCATPGRRPAC